jgi:hypothetical protein
LIASCHSYSPSVLTIEVPGPRSCPRCEGCLRRRGRPRGSGCQGRPSRLVTSLFSWGDCLESLRQLGVPRRRLHRLLRRRGLPSRVSCPLHRPRDGPHPQRDKSSPNRALVRLGYEHRLLLLLPQSSARPMYDRPREQQC